MSLEKLELTAAELPPGANGVTAVDWFNGRRTPFADPLVSGALTGLNLGTTPAMVYRALIEATIFGSKAILEHCLSEGLTVDSVTAVGGISQKSSFIMQMCADILGIPIKVAKTSQACALGAAMCAAAAAGIYPDAASASAARGGGFSAVYQPRAEMHEEYEKVYRKYLALGNAVNGLSC